ncbi:MAG: hypothetical protein WKG07_02255 [Hymenobacter sp.]
MGLTQLLATPAYQSAVSVARLVDGFGQLCRRAGQLGIWVNLGPCPSRVAPTWPPLGPSWVGRPRNGGIMLDSWHALPGGRPDAGGAG